MPKYLLIDHCVLGPRHVAGYFGRSPILRDHFGGGMADVKARIGRGGVAHQHGWIQIGGIGLADPRVAESGLKTYG